MRKFAPVLVSVALFLSCASQARKVEKITQTDFVCIDCAVISPKSGICPFCEDKMLAMERLTVCPLCTMPVKGFCPHCLVESVPGFSECSCDRCGKDIPSIECPPPAEKPEFSCPDCGGAVKFTSPTECTCTRCSETFPSYECMPPCGKCKFCGGPVRMITTPMRFRCAQCGLLAASSGVCSNCLKMMQEIEIKRAPESQPPAQEK